jgi:hypothetical protein
MAIVGPNFFQGTFFQPGCLSKALEGIRPTCFSGGQVYSFGDNSLGQLGACSNFGQTMRSPHPDLEYVSWKQGQPPVSEAYFGQIAPTIARIAGFLEFKLHSNVYRHRRFAYGERLKNGFFWSLLIFLGHSLLYFFLKKISES